MKKEILGTAHSIVVRVSIHNSKFQLGVRDNKDTFCFFFPYQSWPILWIYIKKAALRGEVKVINQHLQ